MSKLRGMVNDAGAVIGYMFMCPGCKRDHAVHIAEKNSCGAQWSFNGNMEMPTFSPSLVQRIGPWPDGSMQDGKNVGGTTDVCHLILTDEICQFQTDCTHELAGKSVTL
jgi:hypothetical protein